MGASSTGVRTRPGLRKRTGTLALDMMSILPESKLLKLRMGFQLLSVRFQESRSVSPRIVFLRVVFLGFVFLRIEFRLLSAMSQPGIRILSCQW